MSHIQLRRLRRVLSIVALAAVSGGALALSPSGVAFGLAPATARVALPAPSVTVSSTALEARSDFTDCVSSCGWCGAQYLLAEQQPTNGGEPCDAPEGSDLWAKGFQTLTASEQMWGAGFTSDDTCGTTITPGCTPLAANGWGVWGEDPAQVSLGAPFDVAQTYWWNAAAVGDGPTSLAIGSTVHIAPPGLAPFDFDFNAFSAQGFGDLAVSYNQTPNVVPCDPSIQRSDVPCDDEAQFNGSDGDCFQVSPCTYTETADGLTWHLTMLGFQDPLNPPGDFTAQLVLPEVNGLCLPSPADCELYPSNAAVGAHPIIAPLVAELTVDTSSTTTSLASSAQNSTYGQPVTLTAMVSPAPSSGGTVAFDNGENAIAGCDSVPVDASSGTASCTTASLPAGSQTLTAAYSGAIGFASSASGSITQTVKPAPLTVNAPSATAAYGNVPSSFTPTYSGLVNGDRAPATPATCTTTADNTSAPGSYAITCSEAVDSNYAISYGLAGVLTITKAPTAVVAAPAKFGLLSITFVATLTRLDNGAPVPGKAVRFSVQGHSVCQGTSNSTGVAGCTVSPAIVITLGRATYTASYGGDTDYLASSASGQLGSGLTIGPLSLARAASAHSPTTLQVTLSRNGVVDATRTSRAGGRPALIQLKLRRQLLRGRYELTLRLAANRTLRRTITVK